MSTKPLEEFYSFAFSLDDFQQDLDSLPYKIQQKNLVSLFVPSQETNLKEKL